MSASDRATLLRGDPSTGSIFHRRILSMALAEPINCGCSSAWGSVGNQPVTLDHLRAGGIGFPAVIIGELELNGDEIERVYEHGRQIGVRLRETEPPIHPPHPGASDGAELRDSHRLIPTQMSAGFPVRVSGSSPLGCQ
jgi:hypothetical protein